MRITRTYYKSEKARYLRGGRCWVKITKTIAGYAVACGWAGEIRATHPAQTTKTLSHAVIIGEGWIKDHGE